MPDATELSDPRTMPWPDMDRTVAAASDDGVTAGPDAAAPADADGDAAAGASGEPSVQPAHGRTATKAAAASPQAASLPPRKTNPLVAGLVRAMRDAAEAARQESAARFTEEAKSRVEAIHAASADEATTLRSRADADVVGIRDWSKAEMARIREETEQRISDRKHRLELELEDHAARVEHRIDRVQGAVSAFEQRMAVFFEQLFAEEDPARLAGMAEQLPDAPSLDLEDDDVPPQATLIGGASLDAEGAAAAEAEALAGLDPSLEDADEPDAPEPEAEEFGQDDVTRRLEAFTGPPAGRRDGAATKLSVTGLVSVASIAGFKRALAKIDGVTGVAVSSGPTGDFVFTINHAPDADLVSAIPSLDGFSARVTGDADGVVTVTASDPDGSR